MLQFKTLKELDSTTTACTVKVTVVHFCKEMHCSNQHTKGFKLLLRDDKVKFKPTKIF